LVEDIVGFIFEKLFYICPKGSSLMRYCFLSAFVEICCMKYFCLLAYLALWQWTSAVSWKKSWNDVENFNGAIYARV